MNIKSSKELVEEANKEIKVLSAEEIKSSYEKGDITLIDIRDIRELWKEGTIKNSIHIPRGLLEFSFELGSPNNPGNANADTNLVFYCAGGYRAALAAETMYKMGFKNVFNAGGFNEWVERNGEVS